MVVRAEASGKSMIILLWAQVQLSLFGFNNSIKSFLWLHLSAGFKPSPLNLLVKLLWLFGFQWTWGWCAMFFVFEQANDLRGSVFLTRNLKLGKMLWKIVGFSCFFLAVETIYFFCQWTWSLEYTLQKSKLFKLKSFINNEISFKSFFCIFHENVKCILRENDTHFVLAYDSRETHRKEIFIKRLSVLKCYSNKFFRINNVISVLTHSEKIWMGDEKQECERDSRFLHKYKLLCLLKEREMLLNVCINSLKFTECSRELVFFVMNWHFKTVKSWG